VCVGGVASGWGLPASVPDDRQWTGGGERTMYELAFALAELGHDVELRGRISREVYTELAAVTTRHPAIDAPSRRPRPGEVVLLLEGFVDPLVFGSIALSEARPVLLLLAPAGLCGWSFEPGWSLPDPLTVDLGTISQASSYQAMAAVGFELWTHSPGLCAAVEAAGVPCRWVGNGSPGPVPEQVEKHHDVAIIGGNRWEPIAREIIDGLATEVLVTGPGTNVDVLRQLGAARLFIHPMRIEGTSRLGIESRLMGTVPVMRPNPYGAGFDEESGAVVVEDVRAAVEALLADPGRVARLSDAGRRFAHRWRDWPSYLERLSAALDDPAPRPGSGARAEIGAAIEALVVSDGHEPAAETPAEAPPRVGWPARLARVTRRGR
jgi:hypothetical protein